MSVLFLLRLFFYRTVPKTVQRTYKNGAKNVEKNGAENVEKKETVSPSISLPRAGSEEDCT